MGAKKLNLEALVDFEVNDWIPKLPLEEADDLWQQNITHSIEAQKQQKNVLWQAYIKEDTAKTANAFCKKYHLSKSELTRILFESFFHKK